MSEIKHGRSQKSLKLGGLLKLVLIAVLGFALLGIGVHTAVSYSNTTNVAVTVVSTDNGTYYNTANGGRVSVNSENVGLRQTRSLRVGQTMHLSAVANEGYTFVGYFASSENGEKLSGEAEYSFNVNKDVSEIYASFAKNYEIEFTIGDPFNEGETLSFTETLYVGQEVTISEIIAANENLGEEYAKYYENSTPDESSATVDGGFSFSKNSIVVGATTTNISIQPSEPTLVGWTSGAGTSANPWIISTNAELTTLATNVNGGEPYTGKYFKLAPDKTFSLTSFTPIGGYNTSTSTAYYFEGIFDGNGRTVTINSIADTSSNNVGLFGYNKGTIHNLTVAGTITGGSYVGAVCGYNVGTIYNCKSTATVSGSGSYIGGLIGVNNKNAYQLYNTGTVQGTASSFGLAVGGVVGINLSTGNMYDSINTGAVTASSYQWVGGLVGQNHGSLKNSFTYSTSASVTGAYYVGGVVGQNGGGDINNTYNNMNKVTGTNYVGGVVGYNNNGTVAYSYYYASSATYGIGGTADVANVTTKFTRTAASSSATRSGITPNGKFSSNITLYGYSTSNLLDALNYGQLYLDGEVGDSMNLYYAWGASSSYFGNYPTIHYATWGAGVGTSWVFSSGSGTSADPYMITTKEQLINLSSQVNSGVKYSGIYFKLGNNIALTSAFTPIGSYNTTTEAENYFNGVFDGAGKSITGLSITQSSSNSTDYLALFGYVYTSGVVKNLNVSGSVTGDNYIGGIVGYNMGKVEYASFTGTVSGGGSYIGGLVGVNKGTIDNGTHVGNVSATNSSFGLAVGGIAGINLSDGIIKNCHSNGLSGTTITYSVSGSKYQWVGGIVGQNHGAIYNSYNNKNVTGAYYVGGVAGQNGGGTIENVYSRGTLSATSYTGTTTGYNNSGTISAHYYNGTAGSGGTNGTSKAAAAMLTSLNSWGSIASYTAWVAGADTFPALVSSVEYTITLAANGGSGGALSSATYKVASSAQTITLTAPTRTGYTFASWSVSNPTSGWAGVSNSTLTINPNTYGNLTVTANWTPIQYAVKFNANGGSGTMNNQTHTYGSSLNLTANAFSRTGYTFAGWATSDSGDVVHADQASVKNLRTTAGTYNLYAKWTPIQYKVKFNANGGSGTMNDQTHTYGSSLKLTANAFSRTGYTFAGWATSASGSVVHADKASVTNLRETAGTYNLYAKWTPITYKVIYAGGGATSGSTPEQTGKKYDEVFKLNSEGFTRKYTVTYNYNGSGASNSTADAEYTFAGWTSSAGKGYYGASSDNVTTAISSTSTVIPNAQYVKNLTTTNSGTVTLTAQWNSKSVTLPNPTRTGYTFASWTTEQNGSGTSYNASATYTPNQNITLYAQWTPRTFEVTANANSGSISSTTGWSGTGSTATKTVTYDATYGTLPTVSRTGYDLSGWYTATSGGSQITASTKVQITAAQTIFARWSAKQYTVTLNYDNGGTGGTTSVKATYDAPGPFSVTQPSKTGYTFNGWYTAKSGGVLVLDKSGNLQPNTTYTDGNSKWTHANNATLYAQYKAIDYTITLNTNGGSGGALSKSSYNISTSSAQTVTITLPEKTGNYISSWDVTGEITGSATVSGTTLTIPAGVYGDLTLTPTWSLSNYTLTVKYYSSLVSHATELEIAQSSCQVSDGSIAIDGTATVTHTYSTTALSVTLGRANESYTYYIKVGGAITSVTNDTNSINYSWAPKANTEIKVYVAERYEITYNGNGKTGGSVPSTQYKIHDKNITLETNGLTRTGYTANGWNTSGDVVGTAINQTYSTNANNTLYANWKANTYTVTVDAEGGTIPTTTGWQVASDGATATKTVTYNNNYGTLPTPTRDGYTFKGWFTAETNGTQITESTTVAITAAQTLHAQWTPVSYTLTYNLNGGKLDNSTANQTVSYNIQTSLTAKGTPTKSGYNFINWKVTTSAGNWASNATFNASASIGAGKYGDATLTAQWSPKIITITLDDQDETTAGSGKVYYKYNTNKYYSNSDATTEITSVTKPTKTGYTFGGYYSATGGGGTQYITSAGAFTNNLYKAFTANETIYAKWTAKEYTVTLNAHGGHVIAGTNWTGFGESVTKSVTYASTYGTLPTPLRSGYTFNGWYTAETNGTEVTSSTTVAITAAQTLHAHWTAKSYTVSFNANGGSVSTTSKTVAFDSTYGTLPTPTRTGYTFKGWYGDNLIDHSKIVHNGFISGSSTTEALTSLTSSNNSYPSTTGWIAVSPSTTYTYSTDGNRCRVQFKSSSGTITYYSGSADVGNTRQITTASDTAYMRIYMSWDSSSSSTFGYAQLVKGTTALSPVNAYGTVTSSTTLKMGVNHTLYAKWELNTYTLTINYAEIKANNSTAIKVNGGSSIARGSSTTITAKHGTATDITIEVVEKSHNYFINVGGQCSITSNKTITTYPWNPTQNAVINVYVAQRYIITYNNNQDYPASDGDDLPKTQDKIYDAPVTLLENGYTLSGYQPNGWNTSSNITSSPVSSQYTTNANLNLYVNWTANVATVLVNKDGGVFKNSSNITVRLYNGSTAITAATAPNSTTGLATFSAVPVGKYKVHASISSTNANLVYTNIDITVEDDGSGSATINYNTLTLNKGTGINTVTGAAIYLSTQSATISATALTGYTFSNNWTVSTGNTPVTASGTTTVSMSKTTTLTANATANTYTITWDASKVAALYSNFWNYAGSTGYTSSNRGDKSKYTTSTSNKKATSTVKYASGLGYYSPIPVTSGKTFSGWYTQESGGTKVANVDGSLIANVSGYTDANKKWIKDGNVTLYAQATANTYSIAYDYAGGTAGSSKPTTYTTGTAPTISAPTRAGYTFNGWTVSVKVGQKQGTSFVGGKTATFVNLTTGILEYYADHTSSVIYEPIYLKSGVAYTETALGNSNIRWRTYTTEGNYSASVSTAAYTPSSDQYAILMYYAGRTTAYTTYTYSASTIPATQVGDLTLTAKWTAKDISFSGMALDSGVYNTEYSTEKGTFNIAKYTDGTTGAFSYSIASAKLNNVTINKSSNGAYNGFTINSTNHAIYGKPTAAGDYTIVVRATDSNNGKTKDATMTIKVDPKNISGTATISGKVEYGQTLTAIVENGITDAENSYVYKWQFDAPGGNTVFVDLATTTKTLVITSANLNNIATVVGGTIRVVISGSGNYSSSSELTSTATATITPKEISWSTKPTVSSKPYDGNNQATISNFGAIDTTDIISADDVRLDSSSATATFAGQNAGTHNITFKNYKLSGTHFGNYTLAGISGVTGIINKAQVKVTAKDNFATNATTKSYVIKTYDGTTTASISNLHYNVTSNGAAATVTVASANYASADAGKPVITATFNLTDTNNFAFSSGGNTCQINGQINQATPILTIANPTLNLDYGGTPGTTNYTYTFNNKPITSDDVAINATSNDENIATVDVDPSSQIITVTAEKYGTTFITLTAGATTNFKSVTARLDINVDKAEVTITKVANAIVSKTYNGTNSATVTNQHYTVTCSTGAEPSVSVINATYDSADAGTRTVTATFKLADTTNFTFASDSTLTFAGRIDAKSLTIAAVAKTTTYGDAIPSWEYTTNGFITGESVSDLTGGIQYTIKSGSTTIEAARTTGAGTYTIVPGGFTSTNYAITYQSANWKINKKALTIKADDKSMDYGASVPTWTITADGFVNGETVAKLGGTLEYTIKNSNKIEVEISNTSPVGEYTITPSGYTSNNYAITFTEGTLTIGLSTIETPTNMKWSTTSRGTATWTASPSVNGITISYKVVLYKSTSVISTKSSNSTTFDFASIIRQNGSGTYTFTVQAISSDDTNCSNSSVTAKSDNLYASTVTVAKGTGISDAKINSAATYVIINGQSGIQITSSAQIGYSFNNWTTTNNNITFANSKTANTTITFAASATAGADITLTASATANTYTVTFDANDGSVNPQSKPVTFAAKYGELPTPIYAGYEFAGWTLNGSAVNAETIVATPSDHTLVANWTAIDYTITYEPNNGNLVGTATQPYTIETNLILQATPKRTGYIFNDWKATTAEGNWETDATFSASKNVGAGKYGNVTLTAQWTPITYKIAFNGNTNTNTSVSMATITATYDQNCTLSDNVFTKSYTITLDYNYNDLSDTVKQTYTFVAWNKEADGSEASYLNKANVINLSETQGATVTLYAQWTTESMNLANPERVGYEFGGWYTDQNLTNLANNFKATQDCTLYAKWTPNQYTVTASTQGGEIETLNGWLNSNGNVIKTVTFGSAYGPLPEVKRLGYEFDGWYTAQNGGNKITSESPNVSTASNHTIFAHWNPITYTIQFNLNNGNSRQPQSAVFDTPVTISNPTYEGYIFNGWKATGLASTAKFIENGVETSWSGNNTDYDSSQGSVQFKNLASTSTTVTLIAQWSVRTDIKYTVHHYVMDTNGDYPETPITIQSTGATGQEIQISELVASSNLVVPGGIIFKEGLVGGVPVTSTTILADGSRVIVLYFDRLQYNVTLQSGTIGIESTSLTGSGDYYYEKEVTINVDLTTLKFDYEWKHWLINNEIIKQDSRYTFAMPTNDVIAVAFAMMSVPDDLIVDIEGKSATILKYQGSDIEVVIPEEINVAESGCAIEGNEYKVVAIAENAFKGNNTLESISIPETITNIGASAFANCDSLRKIEILSSSVTIGENAFGLNTDYSVVERQVYINDEQIAKNIVKSSIYANPNLGMYDYGNLLVGATEVYILSSIVDLSDFLISSFEQDPTPATYRDVDYNVYRRRANVTAMTLRRGDEDIDEDIENDINLEDFDDYI